MSKFIKGELKQTGINEIDIDAVVSNWNHLWFISEWRRDDSWTLMKYLRKDSPVNAFKTTISKSQASELVERLNLQSIKGVFNSGYSWRRQKDIDFLDEYRREKFSK